MLADLLLNIGASIIYDFGKPIIKNKAAKHETVQAVLKTLGASSSLHDFPERYVEALVEFRFLGKTCIVMDFFREDSIARVFFHFYYGEDSQRYSEAVLWRAIAHCIDALKVGDDVKANNIDVSAEIEQFWEIFKQKVHESRTVKEVELEQALKSLNNKTNDIQDRLLAPSKEPRIKPILSSLPYNEVFEGRADDLQKVEALLTQNKSLNIIGINGIGGIGKSSLAKQLFLSLYAKYDFCLFLEGKENLVNTLSNTALINNLGLTESINQISLNDDKRAERITELLTNALLNLDGTKLLLIDNAPDDIDLLKSLLNQKWHILTTSRIAKDSINSYELRQASLNDAVRIFAVYFDLDANSLAEQEKTKIENIAQRLACHILAIELVAKNAKYSGWTLDKIIIQLEAKGLDITQYADTSTTHSQEKITNTFAYLLEIFPLENLEDQEHYLLTQYSVIPAISITADTWASLLGEDAEMWQHYSRQLHKKGWLTMEVNKKKDFLLHALLAEVIRAKKADSLLNDCRTLIDSLTKGLDDATRHINNYQQANIFAHLGYYTIQTLPIAIELSYLAQNIGEYHRETGNLNLMLESYQKMADILTALCATEPDNIHFKTGLAISYGKIADSYSFLGDLEKALDLYMKWTASYKEFCTLFPNDLNFKNGLAISYGKLGDIYTILGHLDKALHFYIERNKAGKKLYANNPSNPNFKNGLALSYGKLGSTYKSLGDLNQAIKFFINEIKLLIELNMEYPNDITFKNGLATSYGKAGSTHRDLSNWIGAIRFFTVENKLFEELYTTYPDNATFKNGLAISHGKLGAIHSTFGNLSKAIDLSIAGIKLFESLYADYPNNITYKNGLAESYAQLGVFYKNKVKDKTKAKSYFLQAETLLKELTACSPQHIEFKQRLNQVQQALQSLE